MITIRKAKPEDASEIIDFQQKMAWETEQMTLVPELIAKGGKGRFRQYNPRTVLGCGRGRQCRNK